MAYTTKEAVQAILGPNYDGSTDLEPFITTASVFLNRVQVCAKARGVSLDETNLERIEAYLAAHFYGHADQFFTSRSAGGAGGSFQGQTGMGLDGTFYGQTAKRLDYSGCLSTLDRASFATIDWLGKPVSEQINYEDRS